VLYRELCMSTDAKAKTMGGCASLLQSWTWYYLPYIARLSRQQPSYPLVCRLSGGRVLNFINVPHNNLVGYRSMIDHIHVDQVMDKMHFLQFYFKILNFNTNFLITMTYCSLNEIRTKDLIHRSH